VKIIQILEEVHQFFQKNLEPVHKIISVDSCEKGWEAVVEVIEEKEYMTAHAKDQMIGEYHVRLNEHGEVLSFKRTGLRSRSWIPK
jgi:hypothetical protein